MVLLGAVLSDTVILNSPTTTERDHAVVEYLERVLALDASELGREMFEATSDVSEVSAEEIVTRDAKRYQVGQRPADLHRPGRGRRRARCSSARTSCSRRCAASATSQGLQLYALMVTDVLTKGTDLLVAGDARAVGARVRRRAGSDSMIELPGRDEPQEAGRAEAAAVALERCGGAAELGGARASSPLSWRRARAPAPRPRAARAGSTRASRGEHVDDHVEVVHQDPVAPRVSPSTRARQHAVVGLHPQVDRVVDRLRLAVGAARADHEVVGVADHLRAGRAGRCRAPCGRRRTRRSPPRSPRASSLSWRPP